MFSPPILTLLLLLLLPFFGRTDFIRRISNNEISVSISPPVRFVSVTIQCGKIPTSDNPLTMQLFKFMHLIMLTSNQTIIKNSDFGCCLLLGARHFHAVSETMWQRFLIYMHRDQMFCTVFLRHKTLQRTIFITEIASNLEFEAICLATTEN